MERGLPTGLAPCFLFFFCRCDDQSSKRKKVFGASGRLRRRLLIGAEFLLLSDDAGDASALIDFLASELVSLVIERPVSVAEDEEGEDDVLFLSFVVCCPALTFVKCLTPAVKDVDDVNGPVLLWARAVVVNNECNFPPDGAVG